MSVLVLCVLTAGAAPLPRDGKVWIFFTDRPYLKYRALHPAQLPEYTQASRERRETRAEIPWDQTDLPLDRGYLRTLHAAGAVVDVESRWLNAVSARCDHDCRRRVSAMPFVSRIQPVLVYRREAVKVTPIDVPETQAPTDANALAYGPSKAQLQQLKVPFAHGRGYAGQGEIVAMLDSGFRKDHIAFQQAVIVAEHDFVFDRETVSDTDGHGTLTWSTLGGQAPGKLYGPAYKASFILATTEDVRSETEVEEDNWVAAFEWADRLGATVVSSSLGYSDWYTQMDFNGMIPVTSRVASMATRKGIVVSNSAGNSGPGPSTLGAPADAKRILTVGAVDAFGNIADFSSRGPTADGRIKPEVVARGVLTWAASNFTTNAFGPANGTSLSCPLIGGFAAVLLSAHPEWTPLQIREAMIMTANRHDQPDNTFGYGIPNMQLAFNYLPVNAVNFDHKPLKNTSNTTQPYRVQSRIRAYRGLNENELYLNWKVQGTPTYQKFKLTRVPGTPDRYQAFIPAQPRRTTILYFLTVKDTAGKFIKNPRRAPAETFRFQIL